MIGYCILVLCLVSGNLGKPTDVVLEYQDSIGQYSFGYSSPDSARSEIRLADGKTRGAYSYVDSSGDIQSATYTADSEYGFRIEATNLPKAPRPVEDTPEVIAARDEHFRAHEEAIKMAEMSEPEMEIEKSSEDSKSYVKASKLDISMEKLEKMEMEKKKESLKPEVLIKTAEIAQSNDFEEIKAENRDVPVVKTSFVMPGSKLNLHNRIELRTAGQTPLPSAPLSQGMTHGDIQFKRKSPISATIYTAAPSYSPIFYSPYSTPYYAFNSHPFIPTFTHYY